MAAAVPIDRVERVPIGEATGRVVARDVAAAVDVPPFDRAAMDGYAVIAADTAGAAPASPRTLTLHRSRVHRPGASAGIGHERMHRDCDRRTDAAGRECRGDGRGDGARRGIASASWPPSSHSSTSAGARTIWRSARRSSRAGQILSPSRIGALAATGVSGVERLCASDGRDRVDRQRAVGCRHAARAGTDL